ncbi:phosphoenolpyruvate synthase [Cohnella sp. GCM10012308]|uniref:phosphoenolpyruvate synthase n=1 Tax=Cohnella sp. GCM10012308 TaxID=3317329 RepID=UPI00360EDAB8
MNTWALDFNEMDRRQLGLVGGKGMNLGELSRIPEIQVPEGFCVTTVGYRSAVENNECYQELLNQLSRLKIKDREQIGDISGTIRQTILGAEFPVEVEQAVASYLSQFGEGHAYAVRSSATAEDLPHASFAGQQDTYLNIVGLESILRHIKQCWASLFAERAVIYRMQHGYDHRQVYLSVIVQRMVSPQASGILFTADPLTSNRKLLSIDAGFGLGEALVSGLVTPDCYKVREGEIVEKRVENKKWALYGNAEGGTEKKPIDTDRQQSQTLADQQILRLASIGRQIEAHFGCPQDIEWCLVDDIFYIVQSRPITTLFPIPEANDEENHVYLSVGHQQMMTDPIKPLGLSLYLLITPAPMRQAGGRLFVDIAPRLTTLAGREAMLKVLDSDPLISGAVRTIIDREFIALLPHDPSVSTPKRVDTDVPAPIEYDPAIVSELIMRNQASIEELKQNIQTKSGPALFDFILEDIRELKKILFDPQSTALFMAAMNASAWINDRMNAWLGEINAVDTLSQSVPNNITSEMGLALLDVADQIRPYPEVIHYLQHTEADDFLEEIVHFNGGKVAREAIRDYLAKYGMRCPGEIDITRTRWSEKPLALVPMILGHIQNLGPNAGKQKFEQGRQEALEKERELLNRLRQLPDGEQKALEAKQKIDLVRNFIGYREYPKYGMISRYFVYKQAILKEAERLVQAGVFRAKEDVFDLALEDLQEVARTNKLDQQIIDKRKEDYRFFEKLTPPRVITSEGEIITGAYQRENMPAQALIGLPVSSGVIEGRARVLLNIENAHLEEGDILVTSFTDPGWTPLFISIKGLVTEVGGLMTHGAVIAREYGLPAVVGVENATRLIKDGQRIRVNGTEGYIEIL